jgi:hypothetical protein
MKKLLLVLTVVLMASFLFVGCTPGTTPDPEPTPEPYEPKEESEEEIDADFPDYNMGDGAFVEKLAFIVNDAIANISTTQIKANLHEAIDELNKQEILLEINNSLKIPEPKEDKDKVKDGIQ